MITMKDFLLYILTVFGILFAISYIDLLDEGWQSMTISSLNGVLIGMVWLQGRCLRDNDGE